MKLDRLHEYLTTATAVVIGGLVSYWFGLLAGEGSIGTILAVFAGFALCGLLLSLRSNVWMLIPVAGLYRGTPSGGAAPIPQRHGGVLGPW